MTQSRNFSVAFSRSAPATIICQSVIASLGIDDLVLGRQSHNPVSDGNPALDFLLSNEICSDACNMRSG